MTPQLEESMMGPLLLEQQGNFIFCLKSLPCSSLLCFSFLYASWSGTLIFFFHSVEPSATMTAGICIKRNIFKNKNQLYVIMWIHTSSQHNLTEIIIKNQMWCWQKTSLISNKSNASPKLTSKCYKTPEGEKKKQEATEIQLKVTVLFHKVQNVAMF